MNTKKWIGGLLSTALVAVAMLGATPVQASAAPPPAPAKVGDWLVESAPCNDQDFCRNCFVIAIVACALVNSAPQDVRCEQVTGTDQCSCTFTCFTPSGADRML